MDQPKPFTGDELRALVTSGAPKEGAAQPSPPQQTGVAPAPLSGGELKSMVEQSQAASAPKVSVKEDLGRSVMAGLGRGAIGLTGLPGDIETLGRYGLRYLGSDVGAEPALPTSQQMIEKAGALAPQVKTALEYKPEYSTGRYAKTISEFVPSMIGGPGSVGARLAGTIGAGAATQAAEDVLKGSKLQGTGYETALKVAASIPGYALGTKAAGMARAPFAGTITPTTEAKKEIVTALAKDIASGGKYGAKASPAQMADIAGDVPIAAVAGKRTQDVIQRAAERVPEGIQGEFATKAEALRQAAPQKVTQHIDNMFGGTPVNPFDEMAELSRQASAVNTPAYQRVFALPHAQSITSPELTQVVKQLPDGVLSNVATVLREQGIDPRSIGMIQSKGRYVIAPNQPMPLQFWDAVKKSLDVSVGKTKDPTTGKVLDPQLLSARTSTSTKLKNALDTAVPEYGQVRGKAAELLGAKNAVDLGTTFLSVKDPAKLDRIYRTFLNNPGVSDDIKREFAYGVAGSYRQMLQDTPEAALKLFTGKDANRNIRKISDALAPISPEAGQSLVGQALAQNLNSTIQAIKPGGIGQKVGSAIPYAGTGAVAGLVQLGEIMAQPLLWAQSPGALATVMTMFAGGKYFNWKEGRIAERVLQLASDPAKMQELAALAAKDPNARSFIQKMAGLGEKYGRLASGATISTEPRPERRAGGRIGSGIAESLMRAAERAKRELGKQTETLLDAPDEHIAKALDIAKRHI